MISTGNLFDRRVFSIVFNRLLSCKRNNIMNEDTHYQNLIESLAEKHGLSKKNAKEFVQNFFSSVEEVLQNEGRIDVDGVGCFELNNASKTFGQDEEESASQNAGLTVYLVKESKYEPHHDSVGEQKNTLRNTASELTGISSNDVRCEHDEIEAVEEVVGSVAASSDDSEAAVAECEETEVLNSEDAVGESLTQEMQSLKGAAAVQSNAAIPVQEVATSPLPEEVAALKLSDEQRKLVSRKSRGSSSMSFLVAFIIIVIMLCLGVVGYLYYPDFFPKNDSENELSMPVLQDVDSNASGVKNAESGAETMDSQSTPIATETITNASESAKVEEGKPAQADTSNASTTQQLKDGVSYTIADVLVTHTVRKGESLSDISKHYYGVRSLYRFIVEYNRDVIKNPNNVPFGTNLKIPRLIEKK